MHCSLTLLFNQHNDNLYTSRRYEDKTLTAPELTVKSTDEMLMLAYAKGNASAFEWLYYRHKQPVYRFFIRQGLSVAVAEELCHETWLKIIKARASYAPSAKFTTYLFTVARRIAIDVQSKKSQQCEVLSHEVELALSALQEGKDSVHRHELQLALKQHILALPSEQREVFLLKQESGFTIEEIATITEQHKDKVKSRWRYALSKLRKGLSCYVK